MNRQSLSGWVAIVVVLGSFAINTSAQRPNSESGQSLVFDTYTPGPCSPNGQLHGGCQRGTLHQIRVVPVATGLVRPWHIAFLPDGRSMLVTELPGRLRIIRDGQLDARPIAGWPVASLDARALNSVLVHPQFAQNRFIYLYYLKGRPDGMTSMALARARLEDTSLVDLRDVFVAEAWVMGGPISGRAMFGPDGMIYMTVNDHDRNFANNDTAVRMLAQDLASDVGKVLRIRDDGGIPSDNPFVGRPGARGQIYTYGHRNATGLAWHPDTRALWATEIGPMGGDELNLLVPGGNYGVAGRLAGPDLQQRARVGTVVVAAWHGDAGDVLDALDQPIELDVLYRRSVSVVEGKPFPGRAQRPATSARGLRPASAAVREARVASHAARRAFSRCGAGPRRLSVCGHRKENRGVGSDE